MREFNTIRDDSLKIIKLSEIANIYNDYLDDKKAADSISEVAIKVAEMNYRPGLRLLAYSKYIESNDIDIYRQKTLDYALNAYQLSGIINNPDIEWQTCHNLVAAYLVNRKYDKALEFAKKALDIASNQGNNAFKVESYLDIGRILDKTNMKIEALTNYLEAENRAEKLNEPQLLKKCYSLLSTFYNSNKLYENATSYKLKQGELIKKELPVDSVELIWVRYDLISMEINVFNSQLNEKETSHKPDFSRELQRILDFALKNNNIRLKNWTFALFRRYFIETNEIGLLYDLYNKQFPRELERLSHENPALYYRLKAYFCEEKNKPDSAYYYFNTAEPLVCNDPNPIMVSNFYNRFGQFLMRHGRDREAIDKFNRSYEMAEKDSYFDYMLSASRQLESIFSKMGDYKNAYKYSALNTKLTDSLNALTKKDQLNKLDINNYNQRQERIREQEKQRQEKKVSMMAGGVAFLLILSVVIFRNYRNQKRLNRLLDAAKKKSEDLLLNILPYETAEELKIHGSAKAKKFNEVTVMFTDFKNFTQASEEMSAEELVKVIHFYFSEFDRIISRYGIEKIKIIGDSYMCAGGLPVINKTHAYDVVSAAVELQSFMAVQRRERTNRSERYFELRIGIHTGPVVAGIVGTKKFAYDIWGDTVNTASRMENCGETGKVNISGTTYEWVKDRFACTYRGKVPAKHKGEIDMYFVDSAELKY